MSALLSVITRRLGAALRLAAGCLACSTWLHTAHAQQMDPRSYSNVPTGQNFLVAAYVYSEGNVLLDAAVPIEDVSANVDIAAVSYLRTIAVRGQSGTIGLVVPYASISAAGVVIGEAESVTRSGFGDPTLRVTVNLSGAPALALNEFARFEQDVIVGLTFLLTAPVGYYESARLINIGTNRWSLKSEIGVSKAIGQWTLEGALAATLYTDNDEFLGSSTREQDPLYAAQGHVIYTFSPRLWGSLDATYFEGGRTSVDGALKDDRQESLRWGANVSFAVNRGHSIKIYFSSGATSRIGADFDTLGMAWQYRWADPQ
jgi:hypothetical protein